MKTSPKTTAKSGPAVLAIDPGNIMSGAAIIRIGDFKPLSFTKTSNEWLLEQMTALKDQYSEIAIEMVASYGMAVGASVFETCVWIGRFLQKAAELKKPCTRIKRLEVKMNLCHAATAKDANITQALVDRFAPDTRNHGKGTKAAPGWFYGFRADVWQAYALGVTYIDEKYF